MEDRDKGNIHIGKGTLAIKNMIIETTGITKEVIIKNLMNIT
jgi:hypothetical protein